MYDRIERKTFLLIPISKHQNLLEQHLQRKQVSFKFNYFK